MAEHCECSDFAAHLSRHRPISDRQNLQKKSCSLEVLHWKSVVILRLSSQLWAFRVLRWLSNVLEAVLR